jgi:hypothetical protein
MVAGALLLCTAALCAAIVPVSGPSEPEDRFYLACEGTMRVSGNAPPSQIATQGIVDLARGRVHGFGIGGRERIVLLTATQIAFSSDETGGRGQIVDGTINRVSGKALIHVRSPRQPDRPLIAMDLDCRFGPPPVF